MEENKISRLDNLFLTRVSRGKNDDGLNLIGVEPT